MAMPLKPSLEPLPPMPKLEDRLKVQAYSIGLLLREAGIGAMTITEGVRALIRERDEAKAQASGAKDLLIEAERDLIRASQLVESKVKAIREMEAKVLKLISLVDELVESVTGRRQS